MRTLPIWIATIVLGCAVPATAHEVEAPRDIVAAALEAHGGDLFLDPVTLTLAGEAVFYDPRTGLVRSRADDYRMWRAMERGRTEAHGADGKVRIIARSGDTVLFEVGYDGETTWTQDGIMPQAEADAYWASNFGFGIIRSALDDGFTLSRAPDRDIMGRPTQIVRLTDRAGQDTLFGVDAASHRITYMAFAAPRGWHERLYSDFVVLPSGWAQAREVTLLYDGVVSNTVYWREVRVGEEIDPAVFTPPAANEAE